MVSPEGFSQHTPLGWLNDNIANPAYNAFAQDIWNPAANLTNAVAQGVCHHDVTAKLEIKPLSEVKPLSIENATRLAVGGTIGAVTYSVCARVAGEGLGSVGTGLKLEGLSARVLASERSALVIGAAAHDACLDAPDAKTRAANALAGATSFYCFDVGNKLSSQLKQPIMRYSAQALTGAAGSMVSTAVSGKHVDNPAQSTIESAALNVFLPGTHELFGKVADHVNVNGLSVGGFTLIEGGRGVPLERYRRNSGLEKVSPTLDQLSNKYFLARVQPSESGNFINPKTGLIHLERPRADELGHELAHIRAARLFESNMQQAASVLTSDPAQAKSRYINARMQQEQLARSSEAQITSELHHTKNSAASSETVEAYKPIFEKEFEKFTALAGKWRPDRDYMLLSSQEQVKLRQEDRPHEYLTALYPEMTELEKTALTSRLESWKRDGTDDRNSFDLIYGMRMTAWRHALKMSLAEDYVRELRTGKMGAAGSLIEDHCNLGEFRDQASQAVSKFLDAYDSADITQAKLERTIDQKRAWLDDERANHDALIWAAEAKLEKQRDLISADYNRAVEPWQDPKNEQTKAVRNDHEQARRRLLKQHGIEDPVIQLGGLSIDQSFGPFVSVFADTMPIARHNTVRPGQLNNELAGASDWTELRATCTAFAKKRQQLKEDLTSLSDERSRKLDQIEQQFDRDTATLRAARDKRFDEAKEEFTTRTTLLRQQHDIKTMPQRTELQELKQDLDKVQARKRDEVLLFKKALALPCNQLCAPEQPLLHNWPKDHELSPVQAGRALSIALLMQGETPSWWNGTTHWLDPAFGRSIDVPLLPKENADYLRNFLKKNLKHDPQTLEDISSAWEDLTPLQQSQLQYLNVHDAHVMVSAAQKYPNAQSLALAYESAKHKIAAEAYPKIETRFLKSLDVKEAFPTDVAWQNGKLKGYFLKRNDPRALYLGLDTNSCMHVTGVYASGTWWNQESPEGGFFVVQDCNTGEIEAASRVWKVPYGEGKGVCFNNVEAKGLGDRNDRVLDIYKQAASSLLGRDGITVVTTGADLTDLDISSLPDLAHPLPLPASYPESAWIGCESQRVLASSEPLPPGTNRAEPPLQGRAIDLFLPPEWRNISRRIDKVTNRLLPANDNPVPTRNRNRISWGISWGPSL